MSYSRTTCICTTHNSSAIDTAVAGCDMYLARQHPTGPDGVKQNGDTSTYRLDDTLLLTVRLGLGRENSFFKNCYHTPHAVCMLDETHVKNVTGSCNVPSHRRRADKEREGGEGEHTERHKERQTERQAERSTQHSNASENPIVSDLELLHRSMVSRALLFIGDGEKARSSLVLCLLLHF